MIKPKFTEEEKEKMLIELSEEEQKEMKNYLVNALKWVIETKAIEKYILRGDLVVSKIMPPDMIARLRERQKEVKRIIALTEKAIGDLTTCFSGGKADYIIRTYAERSKFKDFYNETLAISAKIKELQKKWEKELRGQ
jgi:hypothetical protein